MILEQAKAIEVEPGYIDLGLNTIRKRQLDVKHFLQSTKRLFGSAALKSRWLTFALKGDNVECPCCNHRFVTFLPAGINKRANAKCAHCESLERHRAIWLYLLQKTDFFQKPAQVLNVAPENVFYNKFSNLPNIAYFPIDKYPEKITNRKKIFEMDVADLKFCDNTFDVIICSYVLEEVTEDRKALKELHRVLKPGGWAILNSPVDKTRARTFEDFSVTDPQKRLKLFGQPNNVRLYGRDYIDRLFDAGFEVKVVDHSDTFDHNQRFKYGLKEGDEIYHCYKK